MLASRSKYLFIFCLFVNFAYELTEYLLAKRLLR